MAFKIIWSAPAIGDLSSLTDFIAIDNPSAAERLGTAILGKTQNLIEHPLMGRTVPEIRRKDVRELIQRPYRIIYRVHTRNKVVEIIRIWHAARGEPQIF